MERWEYGLKKSVTMRNKNNDNIMYREVQSNELNEILQLYLHLHETKVPENSLHLRDTWEQIMDDENQTDEAYRRKGYASGCLDFAKKIAGEAGCYKIMLLTGAKDDKTLDFYRRAGYNSNDKTAFIQKL